MVAVNAERRGAEVGLVKLSNLVEEPNELVAA